MRAAAREALEHTGCPLCRLVEHRASHALEAMLWEQATSPNAQPEFLAARGLCFEHSWAMVGASERVFSHGGTAVALQRLLTDFVDAATRGRARGMRRWFVPETSCPICARVQRSTEHFAWEIADLYRNYPSCIRVTAAIPCVPHLRLILDQLDGVVRDEVESIMTQRQSERISLGSLQDALETLVGTRPQFIPEQPFRCPACAERFNQVEYAPIESLSRYDVWLRADRDPVGFDRALSNPDLDNAGDFRHLDLKSDIQPLLGNANVDVGDLCLGHLGVMLDLSPDRALWHRALDAAFQLTMDLEKFGDNLDYRSFSRLTARQRHSWYFALARVASETPDANLHARPVRPPRGLAERIFGVGDVR